MAMAQRGARKTIRQLREERGWAQLDLAVRLGASVGAISKWERGLVVPHSTYQQRLAHVFGVSITELAFGPAEQRPHAGTRQERPEALRDGLGQAEAPCRKRGPGSV